MRQEGPRKSSPEPVAELFIPSQAGEKEPAVLGGMRFGHLPGSTNPVLPCTVPDTARCLRGDCARENWRAVRELFGASRVLVRHCWKESKPADSSIPQSSKRRSSGTSFLWGPGKQSGAADSPVAANQKSSAHLMRKQSGRTKGQKDALLSGDHWTTF